ncbi:MAG: lysoplasmalogenase [Thermoanaerobaculia bacterium]
MRTAPLFLYLLTAGAATLLAELRPGPVALVLKALPLLVLLWDVGLPCPFTRRHGFLFLGLAASLIGDEVIAFVFVGGIAAFLVAHVCYLAAMGWERERPAAQLLACLPAILLWGGMLQLLWPRVPADLKGPVAVYLSVISAMLARATIRAFVTRRGEVASWAMFAGASLFALSDSLIALSRWVLTVPHPELAILSTYYLAQLLIRFGLADAGAAGRNEPLAPATTQGARP